MFLWLSMYIIVSSANKCNFILYNLICNIHIISESNFFSCLIALVWIQWKFEEKQRQVASSSFPTSKRRFLWCYRSLPTMILIHISGNALQAKKLLLIPSWQAVFHPEWILFFFSTFYWNTCDLFFKYSLNSSIISVPCIQYRDSTLPDVTLKNVHRTKTTLTLMNTENM